VVAAVTVVRDVTELTELDRLKDEFISVAAHELKTPVTIMKGYAEVLLRSANDQLAEHRGILMAIDRGANRIDRVVRDLLDISQLHLGRLAVRREPVDLALLVKRIVDRAAVTAPQHRIRLLSVASVPVRGDPERLEQAVHTLVDNAIRYSPRGGDVDVRVAVRAGQAIVSVRDQGVGIPAARQTRIFERFYRAHGDSPNDYGGMGVGLYIAREIVRQLEGTMWFESHEGQGSTFGFSLPLESEDALSEETEVGDERVADG
jgi:signal transduction histidine kinase